MNKKGFLAYRSFFTPINTIAKFSDLGYDTVCVFPANTLNSIGTPYSEYPPNWLWYDKYDFTHVDKMIEDISFGMPDSKIIFMVDLNSPPWLERNCESSVCDSYANLGRAIHNPIWLEATEKYLKNIVKYVNKKYGDRIVAYLLVCGSTDEWYDRSYGMESRDRRTAWRKYQAQNGKNDPVDIPPQSVRENVSHDNFLRDPQKDAIAVDYWRFCSESVADAIIRFADDTRDIVGRNAEIGVFYGYIIDNNRVTCAHLAYENVLDAASIDYLICPGSYNDRQIGGGSGFLIPHGSASVRGKKIFHECDQRTHTYNPFIDSFRRYYFQHWENEAETITGLKREAALGMIKRTHLWWFDMWGGYYEGEAVMKTLKAIKQLWDEITPTPALDKSEVCMIVDPDSGYYANHLNDDTVQTHIHTRNTLNRLGASYEAYSFNDIPLIENFDRYKLVIFPSLYSITKDKQCILDEYVLKNNRSILWYYAPGIINEGKMDIGNCEKLTGISYDSVGLQCKKMERFVSFYVHNYKEVTPLMLKKIAREAGVMLNLEEEIPVYAEGDLIAIHTKDGGKINVTVDKKYSLVQELYTGRKATVNNGVFEYVFSTPDTAMFRLYE